MVHNHFGSYDDSNVASTHNVVSAQAESRATKKAACMNAAFSNR